MTNDIDINQIVVSHKFPFGKQNFKYFVGYKNNKEIRHFCSFSSEMSIWKRYSDKNKFMYFMMKNRKKLW